MKDTSDRLQVLMFIEDEGRFSNVEIRHVLHVCK